MKFIDSFLNNITMYRLVLYYLILLLVVGIIFSVFGLLPFNYFSLIVSTFFIITVSWITNSIFSTTFKVQTNVESVYISALILALIITPAVTLHQLIFLGWAAIWCMASKYIFAIDKKHIFNPVALAVTITAYGLNQSASWWVGSSPLLPFVLVGGILIIRKIKRYDLVFSFLCTALGVIGIATVLKGSNVISIFSKSILDSPLLFFAFIMLTEPLTTPPTNLLQIYYGMIVGFLFAPQIHLGAFYTTPETALLIGNIFSYLVSPKDKLILTLKEKIQITPTIYDFVFSLDTNFKYIPGQYMEWTLGHPHPDSRGNRRYLTLASSPTEQYLRIGVKFYENSSSYKKYLSNFIPGSNIVASQLAGDFVLSKKSDNKYVFIAGGIGITPFRSMIKYYLDKGIKKDIILFYAIKSETEIAYKEIFDKAQTLIGIKTIYTLSDINTIPINWTGKTGRINEGMIQNEVPDFMERIFYLSGPRSMVDSFEETLHKIGVSKKHIITDYFPGFV